MNAQFFLQEFQKLINTFPNRPTYSFNSENCGASHNVNYGTNLFECFDVQHCENCLLVSDAELAVDCINCDYLYESEKLYECQGIYRSKQLVYCDNMEFTSDSYYSSNLSGCHDVFGCVNLTNKSYCVFNRQLTEQTYNEVISTLKKLPSEKILNVVDELKLLYPISNMYQKYNENTTYGRHIFLDKNCYMLFDSSWNEDCMYLQDSHHNKRSLDMYYGGPNMELSYEIVDSTQCFNCSYLNHCTNCESSMYLYNCQNVKDSIGCVGLTNKQYCVLNRQLTKEAYEKIRRVFLAALQEKSLGWDKIHV